MARTWAGFKLLGCAITIVFTKPVEPRRPAMAPPKQYLPNTRINGQSSSSRTCKYSPNSANPLIPLFGFDFINELSNQGTLVGVGRFPG
jgi:hypothetical protein